MVDQYFALPVDDGQEDKVMDIKIKIPENLDGYVTQILQKMSVAIP